MPFTNVAVAPSVLTIEPVTDSFSAATKPFPSPLSSITVAVNVCAVPTRLTACCAIAIFASTQRFVAGPELPPCPLVVTVTVPSPAKATFELAETVVTPVALDVIVSVQFPFAAVTQVFPPTKLPGPLVIEPVTVTPLAFPNTNPVDWSFLSTCTVNWCWEPTLFTPFGLIPIFAPQSWNEPRTKSLSRASNGVDVRVSATMFEKQPAFGTRRERLSPPSKNPPARKVPGGPSFAFGVYGQGDDLIAVSLRVTVAQAGALPADGGGPMQSAALKSCCSAPLNHR